VPSSGSSGTFLDYSPSDYLDVIASPEFEDQIAEILLLYLEKAGDQFNQVDFDEIPDDSFMIRKVVPELKRRDWSFARIKKEMCPQIKLPDSMEQYLSELSSKIRYELRYSKRAETEKKVFSVKDAATRKETREAFDHFVRIHQNRWNREGLPGAFADGVYTGFMKEVTEVFFLKGWMRIKTVETENECLAVDYAFVYNNRVYDYQKAFDSTSPLSKYGPGKTLMYNLIEQSIEEGRTVLDLLRGEEKYKMKIANDFRYNWKIIIPNCDEKRGIKYRLYNFLSRLNNLYERSCREQLILRIHIKQWGLLKFLPNYLEFLKKRLNKVKMEFIEQ
jgi:CelD/BcsL family acetyltransferase involved in cellulose biosynthesis